MDCPAWWAQITVCSFFKYRQTGGVPTSISEVCEYFPCAWKNIWILDVLLQFLHGPYKISRNDVGSSPCKPSWTWLGHTINVPSKNKLLTRFFRCLETSNVIECSTTRNLRSSQNSNQPGPNHQFTPLSPHPLKRSFGLQEHAENVGSKGL